MSGCGGRIDRVYFEGGSEEGVLQAIGGVGKHGEERVTLGLDDDPRVGFDGLADDLIVGFENRDPTLRELLNQAGRALDVGEEEGDGSGRQLPHSRPSEAPANETALPATRISSG